MSRVLDPLQTEAELCAELLPVLERIREQGSDLAGADYDMKAIRLDVQLTKDLDAAQIESLRREFSSSPDIEFGDCWVACKSHWQSIGLRAVGHGVESAASQAVQRIVTPELQSPATSAPWALDIKVAAIWGVASGLAVMALTPYLMQLMPEAFAKVPLPVPAIVALQAVQATLLIGLMSLLGLRLGHRVGLGSPLLSAWVGRRPLPDRRTLKPFQAIALGALAGVAIIAASLVLDPLLPKPLHEIADPGASRSALNGLLASFYGGIVEELQMRLFLMTLLVWLFSSFGRRTPVPAIFWIAIAIAALLFGAGHLPAAQKVWGLTDIVIFRTIALNAVAGMAFGWLYWRRGLETAMLGHFSADIVLHVIAPIASLGPT